jgi:hypothetical protein
MKPGSAVEIQTTDANGVPVGLANVSIDVVLFCGGVERYRFDAGVTDANGRLTTSYQQLEDSRTANQSFALMDYNTRLDECDNTVAIVVPSVEELCKRLASIQTWFPEKQDAFMARVAESKNAIVKVPAAMKVTADGRLTRVYLAVS